MRYGFGFLTVLCCAWLLVACGKQPTDKGLATLEAPGNLAAIKSRGEIVIATRNAPTVSYIDRDGRSSGPEHDLASAFARYLGVSPRFETVNSVAELLKLVADGKADMAAGSISRIASREKRFVFGPGYAHVSQEVVCNSANKPRDVADLAALSRLVVAANTSYVQRLQQLNKQYPDMGLHWTAAKGVGTEELLAKVAAGKIDCTIADSNIVAINRRYFPSLLVMFKLGKPQTLAWPMPKGATKLAAAANKWLAHYKKSGKLADLKSRYYGFIGNWDYVDKRTLVDAIDTTYPKYRKFFIEAAKQYGFDPWLLAAQAYQESHWNPRAVSYTGVRGIMMLTLNTAESLGVDDRLDAEQSILGGAKYLRKMETKLPDSIAPPERYYFALAAYNVGYYHLRDAMRLAKRLGRNSDSWADIKKTLPLLMQRKYYRQAHYGYARGSEAVRYVQRIRDYADIIQRVASHE